MRAFAYVVPTFWTRGSGKRLRGNPAAQTLALYVMTAPNSTMIGLYYQALTTIVAETGIPESELPAVFEDIAEIAKYDFENEIIWVREGAAHQIGDALKTGDKRRKQVARELASMGSHSFVAEFLERYGDAYGLDRKGQPSETKGETESKDGASTTVALPAPCPVPDPVPDPAAGAPDELVLEPPPSDPPPSKAKRKSPETPIPDPFPITPKHLAHAQEKGWPAWWFAIVHEAFCGKSKAKGWRYVAWDAALYDFARGEIGYRRGPIDLAHLAPSGATVRAFTPAADSERRALAKAAEGRAEAERDRRRAEAKAVTATTGSEPLKRRTGPT